MKRTVLVNKLKLLIRGNMAVNTMSNILAMWRCNI